MRDEVKNLLKDIKEEPDRELRELCFDAMEKGLITFGDYVSTVYAMEAKIQVARFHCEDEREFRELVADMDRSRRKAHDAAIASLSMMNKIAQKYGREIFFDAERSREDVAEFCKNVVNEYFDSRSGQEIDMQKYQENIRKDFEIE